jgi:CHAT domain-containing protein
MRKRYFFLPVFICLGLTAAYAQTKDDARPLVPGQGLEAEIRGGETQAYKIALAAGQFMRINATPRSGDVTLTLFTPDDKQAISVNFAGYEGPESLCWEAAAAGDYRLVVRVRGLPAITARYRASLEVKDAAGEQDRRALTIERLTAEAYQPDASGAAAMQLMIDRAQKIIGLCREAGDQAGEAFALFLIGSGWYNQERYEKVPEYYESAIALYRKLNLRGDEGHVLVFLGDAYLSMNQQEKAIDLLEQSLAVRREIKQRAGEGESLKFLLIANSMASRDEKAIEYGAQALSIARELKDRNGEGDILRRMATAYTALSREDDAIRFGEQSLSLAREMGNRAVEARALNSLGASAYYLGAFEKARAYWEQALAIARERKDPTEEGGYLLNIGNAYNNLGRLEKAIECFGQTQAIARQAKNRSLEALAITCIGNAYRSLRDYDKALSYLEDSLAIYREFKDRSNEGLTLSSLGGVYTSMGRHDKAIELLNQALAIHREIKRRRDEGACLGALGETYISLKRFEQAVESLDQALAISLEIKDRSDEAVYRENLGTALEGLGRYDKAAEQYQQSLAIRRELKNEGGEAGALYALAKFELKKGDLGQARLRVEESLKIFESLRADISNQELRASFFATAHDSYQFYVDLLMRLNRERPGQGFDALAVEASERARARGLLELLTESGGDIRQGVDGALLERERALARQINLRAQQLSQAAEPKRVAALNEEIEALENQRQQAQAAIRRASPRYAALTQPQPLKVNEIQSQLEEGTLLLEYSLGEERSFLWAISKTSLNSYELPKQELVEQSARRVYDLLTERARPLKNETPSQRRVRLARAEAQFPKAAGELSRMLLAPVAGELGKSRLVVVADGALQYIPFAMLPDPATGRTAPSRKVPPAPRPPVASIPLIAGHEIVSLPSASTIAVQRRELAGRPAAPKTLAVFADPIFSAGDERMRTLSLNSSPREVKGREVKGRSKSDAPGGLNAAAVTESPAASAENSRIIEHLSEKSVDGTERKLVIPRLPYTRQEADQIVAVAVKASNSTGSPDAPNSTDASNLKAVDFKASRDTVFSPELSQYRYVHFATHGLLDGERPGLSALALSMVDEQGRPQDGFLRAHEIYNLNLPADLVVLSACQTGLGKEVKGEGLVGLTRGFMYAGAARVVVSLWNVNDKATSELMGRFYQKMLKEGQPPAAALRSAQVEMLQTSHWSSAYYWAPFVLQGEWR